MAGAGHDVDRDSDAVVGVVVMARGFEAQCRAIGADVAACECVLEVVNAASFKDQAHEGGGECFQEASCVFVLFPLGAGEFGEYGLKGGCFVRGGVLCPEEDAAAQEGGQKFAAFLISGGGVHCVPFQRGEGGEFFCKIFQFIVVEVDDFGAGEVSHIAGGAVESEPGGVGAGAEVVVVSEDQVQVVGVVEAVSSGGVVGAAGEGSAAKGGECVGGEVWDFPELLEVAHALLDFGFYALPGDEIVGFAGVFGDVLYDAIGGAVFFGEPLYDARGQSGLEGLVHVLYGAKAGDMVGEGGQIAEGQGVIAAVVGRGLQMVDVGLGLFVSVVAVGSFPGVGAEEGQGEVSGGELWVVWVQCALKFVLGFEAGSVCEEAVFEVIEGKAGGRQAQKGNKEGGGEQLWGQHTFPCCVRAVRCEDAGFEAGHKRDFWICEAGDCSDAYRGSLVLPLEKTLESIGFRGVGLKKVCRLNLLTVFFGLTETLLYERKRGSNLWRTIYNLL